MGGNLGVGVANPTEKLQVDGNILASGSITPDYVFEHYYQGESPRKQDYQMPSLEDVRKFTQKHHHLPGVPSAAEIQKQGGILLNRASEIQLEKIEELFLHLIELKEENKALRQRIEALEARQ